MIKMLFVSVSAPITPSKLKLASSTSSKRNDPSPDRTTTTAAAPLGSSSAETPLTTM